MITTRGREAAYCRKVFGEEKNLKKKKKPREISFGKWKPLWILEFIVESLLLGWALGEYLLPSPPFSFEA